VRTPLRVLIVEDSKDDALLLVRDLRRGGYEPDYERVDTPEAMKDALDRREWDVVVSDYVMPHFSAPDALALLKERGLDLPFIILSGAVGEETAVEVMRAGAHDYLLKSNTARLCPAIEREMQEAANRRERRRVEEERERLLQQLQAERGRLEAVLEQMPDGVIIAEAPSGRLLRGNAQAERIWRRPIVLAESVDQYTQYHGFHPDGTPLSPDEWPLARAIRTGEVITNEEIDFLRGDGTRGTMTVSAAPVRDPTGRIIAGVTTFSDITERRRQEAAQRFLAEASAALASSLEYETTLAGVARLAVPLLGDWCVIDLFEEDGSICRVAIAHRDPLKAGLVTDLRIGLPRDRTSTSGTQRLLRAGMPQLFPEVTEEVLEAISADSVQLEALRGLGLTSGMCVPLVARGRTLGLLVLFTAESGRRYTPADLALAEEVARRAAIAVDNARLYRQAQDALRMRDEFISSVSHDLKTPLTTIKGLAQLLRRQAQRIDDPQAERLVEGLANIDSVTKKMTTLIGDLLDVTRLQSGRPLELQREPVDLVALARDSVAEHQAIAEGHTLRLVAEVPELVGTWDVARLERVLSNLLSNAIKYSPNGGTITVSVEREGGHERDSWARLTVQDQGVGIPAADLPHIFERFRRGRNVGRIEGTGLGLAGVRRIVEQHGGTIAVDSHEGAGTTVTVRLPLEPPE
jgi:signal transduction histidine kinase/FixJ family two-component response regulator